MADNRPASVPSWATDTNFSSGPESGNATKVEPSGGAKAQGQVPGQPYRAQRVNWLWNLICQWLFYLSDLHNQVQFLNKIYSWTAAHTFNAAVAVKATSTISNTARLDWETPNTTTIDIPMCSVYFDPAPVSGSSGNVAGGGTVNLNTSTVESPTLEMTPIGSPVFNTIFTYFPVPYLQTNNAKVTSFSFTCDPNADDFTVELIQAGTFGGIIGTGTRAGGLGSGSTTVVIASPQFVGTGHLYFRVTCGTDANVAKLSELSITFSRISAIMA